jgi:hypothetical protein
MICNTPQNHYYDHSTTTTKKEKAAIWGDSQIDLLELIPGVYFLVDAEVAEK